MIRWELRNDLALCLSLNKTVFGICRHHPKTWSWWQLFQVSMVRANEDLFRDGKRGATTGVWCIWVYTRSAARVWDFAIDVRTPRERGLAP